MFFSGISGVKCDEIGREIFSKLSYFPPHPRHVVVLSRKAPPHVVLSAVFPECSPINENSPRPYRLLRTPNLKRGAPIPPAPLPPCAGEGGRIYSIRAGGALCEKAPPDPLKDAPAEGRGCSAGRDALESRSVTEGAKEVQEGAQSRVSPVATFRAGQALDRQSPPGRARRRETPCKLLQGVRGMPPPTSSRRGSGSRRTLWRSGDPD